MNSTDSRGEGNSREHDTEDTCEGEWVYLEAGAEEERKARLFMSATEENLRFASELMNNVSQLVLLARIKLDMLADESMPGGYASVIERVRKLLDRAMTEIRVILSQMTPPLLAELGLEYSLKHLCRQVEGDNENDTGLQVKFADDGSEKPLTDLTRSIVYHAARETLFTVVHDAKTSAVQVRIGRVGAMLQLVVEDREGGYDCVETVLQHRKTGGGAICHCIRHLGGNISFISLPDRRAGICIRVPLAVPQDGGADGGGS
jgi:signal transduction histidine kinase